MQQGYSHLFVKNVEEEAIQEFMRAEGEEFMVFHPQGEGFYADEFDGSIECWEARALKMAATFNGIEFEGWVECDGDDFVYTGKFSCDGKVVEFTGDISLPYLDEIYYSEEFNDEEDEEEEDGEYEEEEYTKEEIEKIRASYEEEWGLPYNVKFPVEEVVACSKIYEKSGKKRAKAALVQSACDEYGITKEKYDQFKEYYSRLK